MTAVAGNNKPVLDSQSSPNDDQIFLNMMVGLRRGAAEDMVTLIQRASEYYQTSDELALWVSSPQPLIGNKTPAELVSEGSGQKVIDAFEAMDAGAFI